MAAREPYNPRWFDGQKRRATSFDPWPDALDADGLDRLLATTELSFVSAAEWRWEEGRRVPRRRLSTSIIGWCHAGSGTTRLAGTAHRIIPHCLQFYPAGCWHDVVHDPGRPMASIGTHFQANLPGTGELVTILGFPPVLPFDPYGRDAPAADALRQLARLDALHPPGWRILAHAELVRLLMHVVLHHGHAFLPTAPLPRSDTGRLAPALALVERELERGPIAVPDLALAAGISSVHLRNLFRRTIGLPPHRYIQSRRIARACRLLRQNDATVAAVANAVGIAEPRVFFRLFRQLTGTTPQHWRRDLID